MKIDWKKLEPIIYILVFCIGLITRLYNLNNIALGNFEAGWAIQAFDASRGGVSPVGPNPGYISLTALLFFIFGDNIVVARIAGVVVGASIVLVPYFFRKELGNTAAFIIACGLAIDPILVANSRLAGGPMLAMGFCFWAFTAWRYRKSVLSGLFAGLALLSGTAVLQGILSFGLAFLVSQRLPGAKQDETIVDSPSQERFNLPIFLVSLAGTLILISSLFFYLPEGLGGFAETLPTYIRNWFAPVEVPALRMLIAIMLYQPIAFLFACVKLLRSLRSGLLALDRLMYFWISVSLVLIFLNPGRQPTDLIWVMPPLWILAGREIAHYLNLRPSSWIVASFEALIIFIILVVGWLNLTALVIDGNNLRWVFLLGLVVIAVVATYLIGLGWTVSDSIIGLIWGIILALGLFVIAEVAAVGQPRSSTAIELWQMHPNSGQMDNFEKTVGDFSEWNTGRRDSIDILSTFENKPLTWILRNFPNAEFVSTLDSQGAPSIIMTTQGDPEPETTITYRGQEFVWQIYPNWDGVLPADWLRWIVYRDSPVNQEKIILWARSDKFPGGELTTAPVPDIPSIPDNDELLEDSDLR